jgi:integrase
MPRIKFTQKAVASLPVPEGKRAVVWDTEVKGLGLLIQPAPSECRSFFWQKKISGYSMRRTIGPFPDISVEFARGKAYEYNASVAGWRADDFQGPLPLERKPTVTLAEALENYIQKHILREATEAYAKISSQMIDRYCRSLKHRTLGSIQRQHIRDLHDQVGEKYGRTQSNRVLQLLKALFNHAIKTELWSGDNPCRGVEMFSESSRERYLQPSEVPKFMEALSKSPRHLKDLVLLAVTVGLRRSNLLSMRWTELDLERGTLMIPAEKIKNKTSLTLPLVDEAVQVLRARRRIVPQESVWIFPGQSAGRHLIDPECAWNTFRKRAGVPDLHFHDLRRSLGSWQAASGVPLLTISKSLGHKSIASTQIYSRLNLEPIKQAVALATGQMFQAAKLTGATRRKLLGAPR